MKDSQGTTMQVTATFSDGTTIRRNTSRVLTHAYLVRNQWQSHTGFAGSEALAKRAAAGACRYGQIERVEVVEVSTTDEA